MITTEQERDRSRIDDKYKWNLSDIYPAVAEWRAQKDRIAAEIPQMRSFEGKLGESAQTLADALSRVPRRRRIEVSPSTFSGTPAST